MIITKTVEQVMNKKSIISKGKEFIPTFMLMNDALVSKVKKGGDIEVLHLGNNYGVFEINEDWDYQNETLQYFLDTHITLYECTSKERLIILTPSLVISSILVEKQGQILRVPEKVFTFEDADSHSFLMGKYRVIISNQDF